MRIVYGQQLVDELRKISESVTRRLWIAVPYLGGLASVRRILGKEWFDSPSINVKLLTDTTDLSCIDSQTLQQFHNRGEVKTLSGLHAKIYIVDDICLVTSANLTSTAFSRRHEIGMILNSEEAKQVVETFNEWWRLSVNINPEQLNKIFTTKGSSKEEGIIALPQIFDLPYDPGGFVGNLGRKFLNYDRLVADYEDFASKYSSIQRIWWDEPLYFEVDGLLNYLYHEAPERPSHKYEELEPRRLSQEKQMEEIATWAANYKNWNQQRRDEFGDDIKWRLENSKKLKHLLSRAEILHLGESKLRDVFSCLNCLKSYPINRTKILSNNTVPAIQTALNELLYGEGQLAARMVFCNKIKFLGTSTMNEILGFTNPDKYPLINRNSNCGLRFFGYQIKTYS